MNEREEGSSLNLDFEKRGGLLTAIAQDSATKEILMVGFINQEAWAKTVLTGKATFFSTSRQKLWTKGETSGDWLQVNEIRIDCDQDAVLYLVTPLGSGACHTKSAAGTARKSCFYRVYRDGKLDLLEN